MAEHVLIDGNNLLYAMHAHAPIPLVGRETMVKILERWAGQGDDAVTLVFDGPVPRDGLASQMSSRRINVRFAAPQSADDIIVSLIHRSRDPGRMRVVSDDTAIRSEARHKRCRWTGAAAFVEELFLRANPAVPTTPPAREKPARPTSDETDEWMRRFGYDQVERDPLDDFGLT